MVNSNFRERDRNGYDQKKIDFTRAFFHGGHDFGPSTKKQCHGCGQKKGAD